MAQNVSAPGGITRHSEVQMDFSCYYRQPEVNTLAIRLRHRCVLGKSSICVAVFNDFSTVEPLIEKYVSAFQLCDPAYLFWSMEL